MNTLFKNFVLIFTHQIEINFNAKNKFGEIDIKTAIYLKIPLIRTQPLRKLFLTKRIKTIKL
jgi:hypothetical protein